VRPAADELIDPPYSAAPYHSSELRAPQRTLVPLPPELLAPDGPIFGDDEVSPRDADLTIGHGGEPQGQRINISGRLLGCDGEPLRGQLVEIWQCNAAGRYAHDADQHPAPLDPHFVGAGRCLTDSEGRFRFVTIRPGAYPWGNHPNAWRPAHIHFSVFGRTFAQRLITQMYFPDDPLLGFDPILQAIRDPNARARLISTFDWSTTEPDWALGYLFDIVVSGHLASPVEQAITLAPTPSQTIGPFFRFGLAWLHGRRLAEPGAPGAMVVGGRVLDGAGDPVPDAVVEIHQAAPAGYHNRAWRGFGRCFTDQGGHYEFVTFKPRPLDDLQAPHLDVSVFARGLLQRCWTRCYFPDEPVANGTDPLLPAITDPDRAATLVAVPKGAELRFDIRLQGERETVFFAW
jgi:protocatechuate 3,4-dioxygenase beta subunit